MGPSWSNSASESQSWADRSPVLVFLTLPLGINIAHGHILRALGHKVQQTLTEQRKEGPCSHPVPDHVRGTLATTSAPSALVFTFVTTALLGGGGRRGQLMHTEVLGKV